MEENGQVTPAKETAERRQELWDSLFRAAEMMDEVNRGGWPDPDTAGQRPHRAGEDRS